MSSPSFWAASGPTLRRNVARWHLAGAALLWTAASGCASEAPEERATLVASESSIERIVIATGTIEPATEVEVRSRIPGIIEKIHVEAGDRVEPGQPLVEIERELLAAQSREARANLEAARVSLRFAKRARDRALELHQTGASSDQARDDASARYQGARAERDRAQAVVDTLDTQLGYASVRSTLTGRVLEVHEEEGSAVSPVTSVTGGTLLLSIAGDKTLFLEGLVDENEIARVQIGQQARIRTEAYRGETFEGEVREIAPIGQRVQNVTYFEVKVEIVDPGASRLRPRMSGDAEIITERIEKTLVIPETALRYRGDGVWVEPVEPGSGAEESSEPDPLREIEIGILEGDRVQVLSGLRPGEHIYLQ